MADSDLTPESRPEQPAAAASQPRSKKPSIFRDPLVKGLTIAAVGLVVLYLVTVLAALMMGVIGSNVPTTRVQYDVSKTARQTVATPADPVAWSNYARALMSDRQFAKAQRVIDQASEVVDQRASQTLLAAQAQLYFEQGKYEETIETADEVRKKLDAFQKQQLGVKDSPASKGDPLHTNYWEVLILKAEAQAEMGDAKDAIKTLDIYLKQKVTAADVFIRRADLKAELGDKAGAEKDYRSALKYLPDNEAALAGLKKIGAEQ